MRARTKILKKDGSSIWVEVISAGIEYERDQAVITHARDISDRKRMEEELSEHVKLLEDLVEAKALEMVSARTDTDS